MKSARAFGRSASCGLPLVSEHRHLPRGFVIIMCGSAPVFQSMKHNIRYLFSGRDAGITGSSASNVNSPSLGHRRHDPRYQCILVGRACRDRPYGVRGAGRNCGSRACVHDHRGGRSIDGDGVSVHRSRLLTGLCGHASENEQCSSQSSHRSDLTPHFDSLSGRLQGTIRSRAPFCELRHGSSTSQA